MPVKRPAKLIKNRWTCCFIPKQMVVRLVMFDSNHWFFWASLPASGSISVATCYKSQEPHYGGLHTWTSSHHHSVWCCRQTYVCTHHIPNSFLIIYPAVSSSFTQLLPNIQPTFIHILPIHFTHHLPIIWRQESTCCRHFHHEGWSSTRQRCSGSSSTSDQEAQEIPHTRRLQKCSVVEMTNLHWFACHIIYIYIIYI